MADTDTVKYSKPLAVKSIAIAKLKPAKYNPRTIDSASLEGLVNSVRDFGQRENLIVNKDMTVISGHMRLRALKKLGYTSAVCDVVELSKDDEKKLNLVMNSPKLQGQFDLLKVDDLLKQLRLHKDLDIYRLPELGSLKQNDEPEPKEQEEAHKKLADTFIVPPFSVIDTRAETWQERKRTWKKLGIKSEVGRSDSLAFDRQKSPGYMQKAIDGAGGGTSIFDPALCEVLYTWFSNTGGHVLDPFAGGSVRGVVAHKLGRAYTGIELRAEQVAANHDNAKQIFNKTTKQLKPKLDWQEGDSNVLLHDLGQDYSFMLSCPPYADLEVYSKDPADISNMDYGSFLKAYSAIIETAVTKLKPNSFACFVVSEVRGKDGTYRNFVADTITAFINAGMHYYNEIILVNPAGSLPIRAARQFNNSRKIGRTHQNILVFYKGNPKQIGKHFEPLKAQEPTSDSSIVKL